MTFKGVLPDFTNVAMYIRRFDLEIELEKYLSSGGTRSKEELLRQKCVLYSLHLAIAIANLVAYNNHNL